MCDPNASTLAKGDRVHHHDSTNPFMEGMTPHERVQVQTAFERDLRSCLYVHTRQNTRIMAGFPVGSPSCGSDLFSPDGKLVAAREQFEIGTGVPVG